MMKFYATIILIGSGLAVMAQNVGIGTNTPASKLDVEGGVSIGATYSGSSAAPANGAIIEGRVGIGTSTPNSSAILDISATDKGVSFPNVTLQSATDNITIPSPVRGLVVWNTGTVWGSAGLYVNTGSPGSPNWDRVSTAAGTVTGVNASAPLSSSGGTNPTISLTGTVPVANGGTGLTAIGSGQILIGTSGGTFLNTNLTGTANQVNVTSGSGFITLGTPQDIATTSNVTFNRATLSTATDINSLEAGRSIKIGTTAQSAAAATAGAVRYNSGNLEVSDGSTWKVLTTGASGDYIQNQFSAQQTGAGFWTQGNGRIDGNLRIGSGDGDKIYLTSVVAGGSKIGHSTGWQIDYRAGNGTDVAPTGRHFFYNTAGGIYEPRLAIVEDGSVGIGATLPQARLDVRGPAIIGDFTTGATFYNSNATLHLRRTDNVHLLLEDRNNNTGGLALDGSKLTVATENGNIDFKTGVSPTGSFGSTGNLRMWINGSNGEVTINNLAGGGDRIVKTNNAGGLFASNDLPGGDGDYIQNQAVGNNFGTGQSASFDITGNAEIGGTLEVNGNVGIGTTSPSYILDVADRIQLRSGTNGSAGIWFQNLSNSGLISFLGTRDNNTFGIYGVGVNDWQFNFNRNTGNVGIGVLPLTNVGQAKLSLSRDNIQACCGGENATLALAENTVTTGRLSSISFHNSGSAEGQLQLIQNTINGVSSRRLQFFDNQTAGLGLELEDGSRLWYGSSGSRTETRDNAGLQGNAGAQSGFYETSNPSANWYPGASSWQHLLDIRHSNPANNYAMQFAGSFFDQRLFFRKTDGNAAKAWSSIQQTALFSEKIGESGDITTGNQIVFTTGNMDVKNGERYMVTVIGDLRNVSGSGNDRWRIQLNVNNVSGCGSFQIDNRYITTIPWADHNTWHTYSNTWHYWPGCDGSVNFTVRAERFDSDDIWRHGNFRVIVTRL